MLDKPFTIPAGTELYAPNLGRKGERFTFTTCWEVVVQPIRLEKVFEDPEAPGDYTLSLVLKTDPGVAPTNCMWDRLEFAIHGEPSTCFDLYRQLAEHLSGISVKGYPQVKLNLVWSGFDPDHGYDALTHTRFDAFAWLRDYFHDSQRFHFFRIEGLQQLIEISKSEQVQIDFRFTKPFATGVHVKKDHLDLYCCVAANLFKMDCEPFTADEKHLEYELIPDSERNDLEVYELDEVVASKGREFSPVRPYFRFQRSDVDQTRQWFYAIRRDVAIDRGWNQYLRFLDLDHQGPGALAGQVISTRAWCTNRHFAQALEPGQLKRIDNSVPETIKVQNITRASAAAWPALHSQQEWDFLAHLALDFAELDQIDVIKTLLQLYHHTKSESGSRRIKGILKASAASDYEIHRGCCLHGQQLALELDSSFFTATGDAALFARVFGHFLNAYCPINGFIRLKVTDTETGEIWRYTARG